jgi:catechol 2,3-dioxygenase-like lactoylglutathione lyase family enzyme
MRNVTNAVVGNDGCGPLTRRDLLFSLLALPLGTRLAAQGSKPSIRTDSLNNVMITVTDMSRSVAFYEKLFGPSTKQDDLAIFRLARSPRFFALGPAKAGQKPGFASYGVAVDDFDADRLAKALNAAGAPAQVLMRESTKELWVSEPDGYRIQLVDPSYGRGSGPRGDVLPAQVKASGRVPLQLQTISHVTISVQSGPRSKEFYQNVLGLSIQAMQGQTACFGVGPGPDFIAFGLNSKSPNATGAPNHACFTIQGFDANRVMGILADNGLEPIEYGNNAAVRPLTCRTRLRQRANNGGGPTHPLGSYELYFNDPDNISIQIQDVTYCGGSGANGQICP